MPKTDRLLIGIPGVPLSVSFTRVPSFPASSSPRTFQTRTPALTTTLSYAATPGLRYAGKKQKVKFIACSFGLPSAYARAPHSSFFPPEQITQFREHVRIYAGVLFGWQLYHKRLELLNSIQSLDAITVCYYLRTRLTEMNRLGPNVHALSARASRGGAWQEYMSRVSPPLWTA
jgi:hypothetical protein